MSFESWPGRPCHFGLSAIRVTVNEDSGKGAIAIGPMSLGFLCALQSLQLEAVNAGILHGNFPRFSAVKLSGTLKPEQVYPGIQGKRI